MFPPEKTTDPNTVLQNLWGSLQRAAPDQWAQTGYIEPVEYEVETYSVVLLLREPIADKCWDPINRYVRNYTKASGWAIRSMRRRKDALVLTIAPRAERAPNPRREPPESVG